VDYVCGHYQIPERRTCRLARLTRSTKRYIGCLDPRLDFRERMPKLARARVRFGYRQLHILVLREGWKPGRTQMYRLYTRETLQLRCKLPRRRKMVVTRRERFLPR
jgi:putative transposase